MFELACWAKGYEGEPVEWCGGAPTGVVLLLELEVGAVGPLLLAAEFEYIDVCPPG